MRPESWRCDLAVYHLRETIHTRFIDLDGMRHINNVAMAAIYQEARISSIAALWRGLEVPQRQVVAHISTTYLQEVVHPSPLEIGTGILEIRRSSYVMGQAAFLGGRCVGTSDCVFVCGIPGAREIPESVAARMRALLLVGERSPAMDA